MESSLFEETSLWSGHDIHEMLSRCRQPATASELTDINFISQQLKNMLDAVSQHHTSLHRIFGALRTPATYEHAVSNLTVTRTTLSRLAKHLEEIEFRNCRFSERGFSNAVEATVQLIA